MYKIALLTPLHPQKTGIADYIEEILPFLRKQFGNNYQIDLFVDDCIPNEPDTVKNHQILEIDTFEDRYAEYDLAIYQMGNNRFHLKIYQLALKYPGIVVMHDFAIHHMVAGLFLDLFKDDTAYFEEVGFNHGPDAKNVAYQRAVKGELGLWETDAIHYPMNRRILSCSLGAIVFSQFAKENLEAYGCNVPIHRVYLHCGGECTPCSQEERDAARKRLKLKVAPDETVIGVFGFIGRAKRPYSILEAVHKLVQEGKKIKLVYVGQLQGDCEDLPSKIKALGMKNQVVMTGFTTHEEFQDYLAASDICISLRYPTMGETSGVLMRALSRGKPSVVTNVGTFQEFDPDMVMKISAGETEVEELLQTLRKLIEDGEFRQRVGEKGLAYAKEHLQIESTAESFADFIKAAVRFNQVKRTEMYVQMRDKVLKEYQAMGCTEDILLDHAAKNLAEMFGG